MGYDKAIKRLACSCGEEQACSPGSGSTSERRPDRKQGQSSMFSGADRMVRARDGSPGCPPGVWTRGRLARERRVCRESGVPWGSWGGAASPPGLAESQVQTRSVSETERGLEVRQPLMTAL